MPNSLSQQPLPQKTLSRQHIRQLLDWYVDMGIDVAVGNQPCNHFTFVPTSIPISPQQKTLQKPLQTVQSPSAPQIASSSELTHQGIGHPVIAPIVSPRKKISATSQKLAEACTSLDELRQTLLDWDECLLKITATKMVFSDGNPKAKVMLVGEAPGADEDRQGTPFVGTCGQLLDNALATIGLNRTNIYITNMIPWRPPGNRPPTTQEIAQCLPFVIRHIELIQPKLLILAGGVATKALLNNNEGIMKLRGQWMSYQSDGLKEPIRTIATYHPAFLLRAPGQKALLWKDLLFIQEELRHV